MSNYRDDTQETCVIKDNPFMKVTGITVEIARIADSDRATVLNTTADTVIVADAVFSKKVIKITDQVSVSDMYSDRLISRINLSESLKTNDEVHSIFRINEPLTESISVQDLIFNRTKTLNNVDVQISDYTHGKVSATSQVSEKIKILDSVIANARTTEILTDTLLAKESISFALFTPITDKLSVNDTVVGTLKAFSKIDEKIKAKDQVSSISRELVTDVLLISDELLQNHIFLESIPEQIRVSETLLAKRTVIEQVKESIQSASEIAGIKRAIQHLTDTVFIEDIVDDGLTAVCGWSSDCDSWDMSRYTDYNYEQLVVLNGQLYGVTSTGLDLMIEGSISIGAKLVTGKLDLGDGNLIHPLAMYLEYSLSGENKGIKTTVGTTQTGVKQSFTYNLAKENSDELTNGRVVFGRGLRGRHFDFTVEISGNKGYINDLSVNITKTKRRI